MGGPVSTKSATTGNSFVLFIMTVHMVHTINPLSSSCLGRSESVPEDFKLNMAAPTSSHMVGRCFAATESGTYFDGTGFLKAGEKRQVTVG